MYLDTVIDLDHQSICSDVSKCDDCYEDIVAKSIYEPEPVDAEMVGRKSIQDNPMYAGYQVWDRKFQMLDLSEDIANLDQDVWNLYRTQIVCSSCNLFYNSRLGYCPNC